MTPAERHRRVAGAFGDRVRGVRPDQWDDLTPVPEWCVRDVVAHLVEWLPAFLASGSPVHLAPGPPVRDDPVGAWEHQATAVQAVLDDPASSGLVLANPHIGDVAIPEAIDRCYTSDVLMHTWDLARATGQDDSLDPGECEHLLDGMVAAEAAIRASGQYGPKVEVAADATAQDRLVAFIGRDPAWRPR